MPNLMIISDNAVERCVLTASSTSGALVAAYMLTEQKGQAHRSIGTSVRYTMTWANAESIGALALPATNLSSTATVRVWLYSDIFGASLLADSGTQYACPGLNLALWNWSRPLNVNAFAYGGVSKTMVYFNEHKAVRQCVVELVDTANPAGYIDCSKLIAGKYWSPKYNATYGVEASTVDASSNSRNDAGDIVTDRLTQYSTLNFTLSQMPESDRAELMSIFRRVGISRSIFVSLLPDDASNAAEQDHMIYGKRSNSAVSFDFFNAFSNKMELEGW